MNWADFHFIRPYWLLAFIPAIVLLTLSVKNTLSKSEWANVCDAELLPFILEDKNSTQSYWVLSALSVAALLSIIALAGPTWERLETPAFRNDAALVIALDLSQTMNATDVKPSRLIRARYKIADILRQRKDGLTALVVYSADAFTVTPLTNDVATIESQLNALESGLMPRQGKDTESVLALAVKLLQQAGQKQGNIFLITDGVEQGVKGLTKELAAYSVSVLGVGTAEGGPVKLPRGGFLKDTSGNIVVPKLNTAELASLANTSGGRYSTITSDDSDIKKMLSSLDRPVSDTADNKNSGLVEQWSDMGVWLLLLVLPLAALGFRRGLLILCVFLILPLPQTSYAVEWKDLWLNKDQQAQQLFKENKFEQAAEKFDSAEWKAAAQYKAEKYQQAAEQLESIETADSLYNQGNSFAKLDQLDKAKEAYEKSLKLNPKNEDAKYNLKLVEEAQKKPQPKGDQKQDEQQQGDQQPDNSEGGSQQADEKPSESEQDPGGPSKQPNDQQSDEQSEPSDENESQPEQADLDSQSNENNESSDEQQATTANLSDEQQQAAEQWLNRIQDDPAGLLKRKFKYQYGQRQQR